MQTVVLRYLFRFESLLAREVGQDLVEYPLVAALVAFGAKSALKLLGSGLNHALSPTSSTLASSLT